MIMEMKNRFTCCATHLLSLSLLLTALTACDFVKTGRTAAPSAEETRSIDVISQREALLKIRVAEIYSNLYSGDLEHRYCTPGYLKIYDAVMAADSNPDEVGFFNYNHWTMAQDCPDNPEFRVEFLEMSSDSVAMVKVVEDEMNTGATLKMEWSDGDWYVADFFTEPGAPSETAMMLEYLGVQTPQ